MLGRSRGVSSRTRTRSALNGGRRGRVRSASQQAQTHSDHVLALYEFQAVVGRCTFATRRINALERRCSAPLVCVVSLRFAQIGFVADTAAGDSIIRTEARQSRPALCGVLRRDTAPSLFCFWSPLICKCYAASGVLQIPIVRLGSLRWLLFWVRSDRLLLIMVMMRMLMLRLLQFLPRASPHSVCRPFSLCMLRGQALHQARGSGGLY